MQLLLQGKSNKYYITYPDCVSVALVNMHAKRMRHIVMWPAPLYHIFPHYLINSAIFGKKVIEHKMCFGFLYNFVSKQFSFY